MAIITRTKNRHLLLVRAVKSVLTQTDKNYIHVIVNDGGDENSLESLLAKYPDTNRIVLHNKEPKGLTRALNQGIKAVDTKYISILDDDDSWTADRVSSVNDFLDNHSSVKGVAVVMDRIIEKIEGDKIVEISRNRWLEGVDTVNLYKQCLDNYLSNGCFNYTREVYDELDGYDESLNVAEDWDFGIRYLLKYDAEFLKTEEALTFYHHRPDQKGDSGNSVFAGVDTHYRNLNILRNNYLRKDINKGVVGVGYIMNNLAYLREREEYLRTVDVEKVIRLEQHMNHVGQELRGDIVSHIDKSVDAIQSNTTLRILRRKIRSLLGLK